MSVAEACRLCLEVNPDNIDVFSEEGEKRSLAQKIWKHLSVWIDAESSLPRNICQQCTADVEHFSCFYTEVQEVQRRIHSDTTDTSKDPLEESRSSCNSPNEPVLNIKVELDPFVVSNINESNSQKDATETCNGLVDTVDVVVSEEEEDTDIEAHSESREASDSCQNSSELVAVQEVEKLCDNQTTLHSNNGNDLETAEKEEEEAANAEMRCSSTRDVELSSFYKFCCELCKNGEMFDKYEQLDKHCRMEHKTKGSVVCCDQQISGEYHLKRHMYKHLQHLQLFKCQECGKEFRSQWNVTRHMVSKHVPDEKRPFKCKQCSKGFATKNHLQLHEKHHQSDLQKLAYVCDTCGKRYSNPYVLHHHQLYQHEKEHSAMCHICAKTFPTHSTLRRHLETHETSSDHHCCPECGKVLKNKDTLRSHMKLHSGKQFPCPECDKVFSQAPRLREHLRCHSSLRPYECLVCNKSFKRKIALTEHMVQHTGERPNQCPYCPRTFASRANYHTHKRRMHSSNKSADAAS